MASVAPMRLVTPTTRNGARDRRRRAQRLAWMWARIDETVRDEFRGHPAVAGRLAEIERKVQAGELSPEMAARELLRARGG